MSDTITQRKLQLRLRDEEIRRLYAAEMRGEKPLINPHAYTLVRPQPKARPEGRS